MLRKAQALFQLFTTRRKEAAKNPTAVFARASVAFQQNQLHSADSICRDIVGAQPCHVPSLRLLAEIAVKRNMPLEAIDWYGKVIDCDPSSADAHYKRGNQLNHIHQSEAALSDYESAIALDPRLTKAICNRGVVLERLGRLNEARASFEQAITLEPEDALAHYNLAGVLRQLGRPEDALSSYDRAIDVMPDYQEALWNRGLLLTKLKRWDDAMASYDQAIASNPASFMAYYYRGSLLQELRQWDDALASYNRALELNPEHAETYCNRGALHISLRRWDEALADLGRAIALKPELPDTHFCLGNLYAEVDRIDAAIGHFDRAIALRPAFVDAFHNRGNGYLSKKMLKEAIADYEKVVAMEPDYPYLLGTMLHARMNICDWTDIDAALERVRRGLEYNEPVSPPFPALTLVDSEALHLNAARLWAQQKFPADRVLPAIEKRPHHDVIRIGYFSADFYDHPVSVLTAQLFEIHNRSRFEVTAFSLGPDVKDGMRGRLNLAFDRFVDVRGMSDRDVALLARSLEIDLAIDLTGFTANHRTGIFALRSAPIQISFLGFPGSMGAEYIDYLVGDQTVIPQGSRNKYSEQIIYLPDSYLPNDTTREISRANLSREDLGLPQSDFVFCCFNNNYKITPRMFSCWMQILLRCENSVLWLAENNPAAAKNLGYWAATHGVDESRLIFAKRMPSAADHLSRLQAADLFLDTLPYNAHATAIDALWAGLPLLTCLGASFAGRVAASLLKAIELPELVATTLEEYQEMAVELALNRERTTALRSKLARHRVEKPLFDSRAFAKQLEAAYTEVYERYHKGAVPAPVFLTREGEIRHVESP